MSIGFGQDSITMTIDVFQINCVYGTCHQKRNRGYYLCIIMHNQLPSLNKLRKMLGISIPRRSMNYYTIRFLLERLGGLKK